jgi:general stress protein 26
MSDDALEAVVRSRKYLLVATVKPSGRPHAAPSSFVWHNGCFWLPTESGAVRVKNLTHNPYASLVLAEGEDEYHGAILTEGPVELVPTEDAPDEPGKLWLAKLGHPPEWADVWIVVRPARLFSYAAEKWAPPHSQS